MNYAKTKILDLLGQDSYPSLCTNLTSETLKTKLEQLNCLFMREAAKQDFEFFYNSLTLEELAEFLYVLCNY